MSSASCWPQLALRVIRPGSFSVADLPRSQHPGLLRLRREHQRVARRHLHPGLARLVAHVGDVDLHGDQLVRRRQPVLARHPAVLHHPGRAELVGVAPAGTVAARCRPCPGRRRPCCRTRSTAAGCCRSGTPRRSAAACPRPAALSSTTAHAQVLRRHVDRRLARAHGPDDVVDGQVDPARLVAGRSARTRGHRPARRSDR